MTARLDDPLHGFRFKVDFETVILPATSGQARTVCKGAFSEISGMEATMEPFAISEGGRSWGQHQRVGRTTFSTVILKRGITTTRHLWNIFQQVNKDKAWAARMKVTITLQNIEGVAKMSWTLENALPVKMKLADLNASGGEIAVEELHLVHEGLVENPPAPAPAPAPAGAT